MRIVQHSWRGGVDSNLRTAPDDRAIQLVLAFGDRSLLAGCDCYDKLSGIYAEAEILLCSTAGEICGTTVAENSLSVTAIEFDKSSLRTTSAQLSTQVDRHQAGRKIAQDLDLPGLSLVLVFADGQNVNGSELVAGLNAVLQGRVPVAGGLAGDGSEFVSTLVGLNGPPQQDMVVAIGLYGADLEVGNGSQGGWEPFGPERKVTDAHGNVLLQLDGQSALSLYKHYLGDRAGDLPGSGLLFPLAMKVQGGHSSTVRTLLAIDEAAGSLIFAGDVPVDAHVRLMRASMDGLIDGAIAAAVECSTPLLRKPELAILVSCVGRKLVLNQRIEEEIEEVAHILGDIPICGFYSYGELAPARQDGICELHNQTMTITTLSER